jgi:ABC-type microcin C transport system permease subunit YejB
LVALLKRLLYILPVIWLVVSLVFLLIHLVPGDPVQQMLVRAQPLPTCQRFVISTDSMPHSVRNTFTTGAACCTGTWEDHCA